MTDCSRPLQGLLEAELEELEGRSDTELARHIKECARCSQAATRILRSTEVLHDALSGAPPIDAQAIVARAKLSPEPGAEKSGRNGRRTSPLAWRRWAGLAAAAAIAAVLLTDSEPELPGVEWQSRPRAYSTVEAPVGQDIAVFETENPDITVLWFF